MIPDYAKFVRFQDKKLIPFIYVILFVVLGFYWKNNAYSFTSHDAGVISFILAITLFTLLHELKAYWAYSYVINRINLDALNGRSCSTVTAFFARPAVVSVCSVLFFWLMAQACLRLPASRFSIIYLYLISPVFMYLVFRTVRRVYIRQVLTGMRSTVSFRNIYQYTGYYVAVNTVLNVLSVSPLQANPAFSFSGGYFSARLMIAMLILCGVVLAINLAFSRLSKRYLFLGRIFLKEITIYSAPPVPFGRFISKPFLVRIILLAMVQAGWIFILSFIAGGLTISMPFVVYFLLCYLPCLMYHFLHVYAYWLKEFHLSCDMYFRYESFMQRKSLNM